MTEVLPTLSWQSLAYPVVRWAKERPDVLSVALVGSWARGTARAGSDIDLILLAADPNVFRESDDWLAEIAWDRGNARIKTWFDADYGVAWSRHIRLDPGSEIELTFCAPSWAAASPPDPGTIHVLSGGCCILLDKEQHLNRLSTLIEAVNDQ